MTRADRFARRLLVSTDAMGYRGADEARREVLQASLLALLDEAAEAAGLARAGWERHEAGDGELAVLPPTEPEPRVVGDFPRRLAAALARHNRVLVAERRLRIRMAIHHGTAVPAPNGFAGQGVVVVSRLLDSAELRDALAVRETQLALMLSGRVFTDTVLQRHTTFEPGDFRAVTVRNKGLVEGAWIWTPDPATPDPTPSGPDPARARGQGDHQPPAAGVVGTNRLPAREPAPGEDLHETEDRPRRRRDIADEAVEVASIEHGVRARIGEAGEGGRPRRA